MEARTMMKPCYRLVAGHLLALAAGMALALAPERHSGQAGAANPSGETMRETAGSATARPRRASRAEPPQRAPSSPALCRQAWDFLQKQSAADRLRIRPMLLAEWAKVDLEGALEAALLEADSADLLEIFGDAFEVDPGSIKACFAGERYGLKTAELRDWWIRKMAARNPEELLAEAGGFGPVDREKIVNLCLGGMLHEPERLWGVVDGLAALPDTAGNRKLWAFAARSIASGLDSDTVVNQLSTITGTAGDVMITEAMAVLLNRTDYEGARATYAALPPDLKPGIVNAALTNPGKNVNAFLAALDEVINTPDWTKLQKPVAVTLHEMSPGPQYYQSLLAWAARMPERDDTMDLYRVAVRSFVANQPMEARRWIESLPQGWKQQNSLTAYIQSALAARNDLEGAKWALPQISDPRFRAEADGFFKAYEQKNGVKTQ